MPALCKPPVSVRPLLIFVFLLASIATRSAFADDEGETASWRLAVLATIGLVYATNPAHADRLGFELATADDVEAVTAFMRWDWHEDMLRVGAFRLDSYLQFELSRWQSTLDSSQRGSNNAIGLVPMFRFIGDWEGVAPYFDIGIGSYLVSTSHINDRNLGTNFQFGDQIGLGVLFGEDQRWEAGYKFQHHSNGSIQLPNDGINFHMLNVSWRY
jgi:hypothetical protein